MKKALIGILVFIAIVFGSFALKPKTEFPVSLTVPKINEPVEILPSSFTMIVEGDFNDPTIVRNYESTAPNSATLMSSGEEKLNGEAYYTYAAPGTDGNLISCQIKNNEWIVAYSDEHQVCRSLARLATTRTELIKQITDGKLKKVDCGPNNYNLCYKL